MTCIERTHQVRSPGDIADEIPEHGGEEVQGGADEGPHQLIEHRRVFSCESAHGAGRQRVI